MERTEKSYGKTVDYINNTPELRSMPTEDMFTYFLKKYDVEED